MTRAEPPDDDLREILGLPEREIYRSEPAPRQVDRKLLRQFHDDQLPPDLELEILDLTLTYREWALASRDVLLEIAAAGFASGSSEDETNSAAGIPALRNWTERAIQYAKMSFLELMAELPAYTPAFRSDPLAPYRQSLRKAICLEPSWEGRRAELMDAEEVALIMALAENISASKIEMPFPPELVAAILVKEGLDDFCKGEY